MQAGFKVLLVSDPSGDSHAVEAGLIEAGSHTVLRLSVEDNFLKFLADNAVDLIVVDVVKPESALFEKLAVVYEYSPKPVVCFSHDRDCKVIAKSVKAGVTAYIVDGKETNRIKPIIDVAMLRFRESQAVLKELAQVKDKLSERGVIEKAKGLLIENKNMSEDQAYQVMRKMAMDQGKKISVVAHEICGVLTGLA